MKCPYCESTYEDHVRAVDQHGWCGNAAVSGLPSGHTYNPEPDQPTMKPPRNRLAKFFYSIAQWLEDK